MSPSAPPLPATLAHELRTPLHAVLASAALLDGTGLTAEQRAHVATIREAVHALVALADATLADATLADARPTDATLADAMVADAMLGAGDSALDAVEVTCDPREVVEGVRRLLAPTAHAKGLALHAVVDADAPAAVHASAGALRQVLVNLVGNAIKFTAAGRVDVRVRRSADPLAATIEVCDTGPGLDDAQQAALFRPYVRHDQAVAGTGLGLAIVASLVRRAGGELGVRGAPGAGCTFWLALREAPALPAGRVLAGRRVLVVDDDALGRRVTAALLERLGAVAHAVATIAEADAALRGGAYDAALLDCHLPDGDGATIAGSIRRREREARRPRTRVVALTASTDDATRRRCLDAGMDACLAKPVGLDALRDALVPPTEPAPPPPIVDAEQLDALARLEEAVPGLLADVAEEYARAGEDQVACLHAAVSAGDAGAVARAAHVLRGASANAGAARAAWLAARPITTAAHVDALAAAVAAAARVLAARGGGTSAEDCRVDATVAR